MAISTWLHAVSGNFNTAADWSSGVPNGLDDAELSATGTYTVTSSESNTVFRLGVEREYEARRYRGDLHRY
jgi:hypothetical protein